MLGNGRLEAMCFDGQKRLCHIRGKLRKKVWINTADIILIGLRDFQDEKADVILKYTPNEARQLKSRGEIPENGKHTCWDYYNQPLVSCLYLVTWSNSILILLHLIVNIMDTSQFGQDAGGDDIYFDEQYSDDDDDPEAAAAGGNDNSGNLNRRNNNMTVQRDMLEDMTESDDDDSDDE